MWKCPTPVFFLMATEAATPMAAKWSWILYTSYFFLTFSFVSCCFSHSQSENSCTFCPSVTPPPNMCSDFSEYHKKEGCCSPYSSNLSIYANSIGIYNLISTDCLWNTDFTDSLFSMRLGVRLCIHPNFGVCERWRLWGRRWRCHIFVQWAQRLEEGKMSGVHECGSKKTMTEHLRVISRISTPKCHLDCTCGFNGCWFFSC